MHKFKVSVGDWSDDGHGESDDVWIESTHSVEVCRDLYRQSCNKFRVSFDHETGMDGLKWEDRRMRTLCSEYGEHYMTEYMYTVLKEAGFDFSCGGKFSGLKGIFDEDHEDYDEEDMWIDGDEHFVALLGQFIKLSDSTLEWNIIKKPDFVSFNGWWGPLNVHMGYGLYSGD